MRCALAAMLALIAFSCAKQSVRPSPGSRPKAGVWRGQASYYSSNLQGRKTASGEPYDGTALTAAHRRLPIGSRVRVTNLRNGKSVVVRINDRGPYGDRRRIIDLSMAAAEALGMTEAGVVEVEVRRLRGRAGPGARARTE